VVENQEEVSATFYERVKDNLFKPEDTDHLQVRYIVQVISISDLEITYAEPAEEKKPKSRKAKKATQAAERVVLEVIITMKSYKALTAAAKKFKPEESDHEDHSEDEESEGDEKVVKVSKTKMETSKIIRIKGPRTQKSQKGLEGSSLSISKSKLAESEDEDGVDSSVTQKAAKGKNGKAKAKPKPVVYKKGVWNPEVILIEKCEQLESESIVPNFDCSTRNSNREVIRAAKIGSRKLLEKIIESDQKISRLTERWGIDNDTTALKIFIDRGDIDSVIFLLEQITPSLDKGNSIKFGKDNVVYIQKIDTGYNDKYAYGVATRKVNVSRGGRQGNNAFVEDHKPRNQFDDDHMTYMVCNKRTTPDDIHKLLGYFPNLENQFIHKAGEALRCGNIKVATYLFERGQKNDGYGLSEWFSKVLNAKDAEDLKDLKKINCTKKGFGMGNLTPIHCACLNPNSEVIKHVLSVNPEHLNMDDHMRKPIHYAACCPSTDPLKYLVSINVDTRELDQQRVTPLMYAAKAGHVENVKYLLEENRSIVASKDRSGRNAIHYAAENGHREIVKLLIDAGIKIALGGPERKTPLHLAAAKGDLEMVKFLVELGAKGTAKDKYKLTPLNLAAKNGNLAIASFLLQRGSPFDEPDSSGNTPLHYACAYGYPEMIDVLIQAGANPNSANSWNLSPTAVALLKSYFSCLRRMLDNPATDVNCVDDEGRTLVSNAIKTINAQNFNHVAFLLRDKNADPNIADAQGLTAFDYLCAHNVDSLANEDVKSDMTLEQVNTIKAEKRSLYKKYFAMFLECGADVNHKDKTGLTPIFRTLQNSNMDGFNLLLDQKTLDLRVVSDTNNSVYHYIKHIVFRDDFLQMAKKLAKQCSDRELMNVYNDDGKTPLLEVFAQFMRSLPGLRGSIYSKLVHDFKLKKREDRKSKENQKLSQTMKDENEDDEDNSEFDDDEEVEEDGPRMFKSKMPAAKKKSYFKGLKGGARTTWRGGFHGSKAAQTNINDNSKPALESIALTQEDNQKLEKEADNLFKDKLEEYLDFLRFFRDIGANVTDLIKDPKKKRERKEEDGDIDEEDLDYSIEDYFARLFEKLENAVDMKIDIPEERKPARDVGYSLLHLACNYHNQQVVDFLLKEYNINNNQKSVYGESELLKYIEANSQTDESIATLEDLIKKGCDVELRNIHQQTAILLAMVLSKHKFIVPLIRFNANVNVQDIKGNYPLLQAIKHNNLPMVEVLLANRANPNLIDKQKRNSIHWAINLSKADADASNEIENCLLSSGGDLNAVDSRGRCPLHYAFVKIGDPFNASAIDPIETVSNIIARTGVKVDQRDNWGNTPLSYAAQRGAVISTLYLLKHEADIDVVNVQGNTPVNICLLHGHQNMCIFLIQKNCNLKVDVKVKKDEDNDIDADMEESEDELKIDKVEKKRKETKVPKKKAKANKKVEDDVVEYESSESILEEIGEEETDEEMEDMMNNPGTRYKRAAYGGGFGSTVNFGHIKPKWKQQTSYAYKSGFGGNGNMGMDVNDAPDMLNFGKKEKLCSTFSIAIRRNWQSVAFLMLEFGFDLSLAILDCFSHRKYNYVYTLLLKKAEAGVYQTTNAAGQNLTHLFAQNAAKVGDDLFDKILAKLEAKGLDFGSADTAGRTSLHYACEAGSVKLVSWLLERGLDVNQPDASGVTPLGHLLTCSFGKAIEFATEGLKYGLDLNKKFSLNDKQHTALTYIIAEDKSTDTFIKLHEMGADINLGDSDGWTPLIHLIRENREEDIKNFTRQFRNMFTNCIDSNGKNVIHHVVSPRDFGSYENVSLLEHLSKLADVNHIDKHGRPPLFYAKQQDSGRMEKALRKFKAKDYEIEEGFARAGTSILSAMQFPEVTTNYEEDFDKFVDQCKEEAGKTKEDLEERCPVDRLAVGNYEVVNDGDDPYDCYMVKVDISYGFYSGNTFYRMQLLREKVRDVYILFTRWGRVGTDGQYQQTPFSNIDDARKEYCSVFKSKTGNMWEDRHNFQKMDKKYRLVPIIKKVKIDNYIKAFNYKDPRLPRSQLEKHIYKLIRRVCNYKVISTAVKYEYHIDSSALPLQNISKERLMDAEAIVKAIATNLEGYNKAREKRDFNEVTQLAEDLSKLTSEFYELLPTDKYTTESIPPITNSYMVAELRKMLNDLIYFEISIKMLGAATYNIKTLNPVDYIYRCMNFKIQPLDQRSDEYLLLR
jgi:ankyrin repeat protein/predicted DNA-binding WGR domain protein